MGVNRIYAYRVVIFRVWKRNFRSAEEIEMQQQLLRRLQVLQEA